MQKTNSTVLALRNQTLNTQAIIDRVSTHAGQASEQLWIEFWTSLASLLRSYTAAHGLNRKEQATVELGEDRITVRISDRWLSLDRLNADIVWNREDGSRGLMRFTIEGRLLTHVGDKENEDREEEMDLQAELWARELMQ
ncbi:hypothetical protein ACFPT7_21615 [Acidicapsa dinghuensis]|uniref:Uncharacterized protein n=1 Tax=Acidicapsa dinghuensis TaxID=2218256 RepID=A0ABW1EKY1_9BACT|nr:hypothetical protein [Acidicapsa dinghuensis]